MAWSLADTFEGDSTKEPRTPIEPPEDLRAELSELIDYTRFEQEWAAFQVQEHKTTGVHRKDCSVCTKMDTLNSQAVTSILHLCEAAALAALPEKKDTSYMETPAGINIGKDLAVAQNNGWNDSIATAQANIHSVFGGTK